jgi:hypothetical protein
MVSGISYNYHVSAASGLTTASHAVTRDIRANNASLNTSLIDQNFLPWGDLKNLTLNNINYNRTDNNNGPAYTKPIFRIQGSSGNKSGGFVLPDVRYMGKFVSLTLGNISKPESTKNSQISFVFQVNGARLINRTHAEYKIIFVNGFLDKHGWIGNNYYEGIESYSSKLINLADLIKLKGDKYAYLKGITITVQRQSTINMMEFKINFYNNLFVIANIFHLS